jgi:hypothetical protein
MSWVRLYMTVEGETELKFAKESLVAHLAAFEVEVRPRMVLANRKLGKRGGSLGFQRLRDDTQRLMKEDAHPEARFTTMIDLYALPTDFPGWEQAIKTVDPASRVAALEKALSATMDSERFLPYLQLHEFEALLYSDLSQLAQRIPGHDREFEALRNEVENFHPEEINEGLDTAPSKRLIDHVPNYERLKVRVGAPAAVAIGIPALRKECPHFDAWLTALEHLPKAIE